MSVASTLLLPCGAPSSRRWAEPCRRPSCPKCLGRFVDREIEKAVATFGLHDGQLGWLTIDLGTPADVHQLCTRAKNRLRNTLDSRRRRLSHWDEVEVRTLFRSSHGRLTLSRFVSFGGVAPEAFARVLAGSWSPATVRVAPLCDDEPEQRIREYGHRWHTLPETGLSSFRSMRLTVGPRWVKRTRHWAPATAEADHREPMPISLGYEELGSENGWSPW